jgi:ribonuclease H2 subunit A
MDPVFGWGVECRFSWGTVKEMLEVKNKELRVDWPEGDDENEGAKLTDFFKQAGEGRGNVEGDELRNWYGHRVEEWVF